uniref:Bystin n=1 Tax=Aureoumbra lagunensis TaxID=44058 RepID=A0A7S3NQ57_9STRA|mmetsp:Transcript_22785/g.29513  ORF Transcript_22785/g.29513 Transcript_22785/m.29513 type:complete len:435 (-) Transcript_22785:551-1855(-)|eukprot:CAMPEP_0197294224 /NCGR_PEP_ID=MMETSP0890-20130614/31602_1 /TAXON_ID=44058 ORGANISM="Aureoumbra lagunensis, Strain CCMP1510" /NCGR_SAMPLE_ID=MMETSP0890 /ASSEMBLY_ACC=CAM_ASM_000533 /LENGTH=434 /DNA_ID=CAMNT_0042769501 /DNA_START=1 /DNA_END=1305 /DNA_ORIENTATION=+
MEHLKKKHNDEGEWKRKKKEKRKIEPLETQLLADIEAQAGTIPEKKRAKRPVKKVKNDEIEDEEMLDEKEKSKVLKLAREQRIEVAEDAANLINFEDDDDEVEDEDDDGSDVSEGDVFETTLGNQLTATESRLVDGFMHKDAGERRTLASIILEKIAEKEAAKSMQDDEEEDALPPQVVKAFTGMVSVLSRYRSGKLPKALKVVPALERWEEVLWLARPDLWSPQCVLATTKVFASNLDPERARIFYSQVLLERCRDDIRANKKLNYHLYQSLYRALFKPAAWFKGILLPLATSGDATLKEALIFGSVLAKASIPQAHAAVVLFKLAQIKRYNGATSVFLVVLLNKKFALPLKVVTALADHFISFASKTHATELPVLWHQSLLVFVQRYKRDIPREKLEAIKHLIKVHSHHAISNEIRREITIITREQQQHAGW